MPRGSPEYGGRDGEGKVAGEREVSRRVIYRSSWLVLVLRRLGGWLRVIDGIFLNPIPFLLLFYLSLSLICISERMISLGQSNLVALIGEGTEVVCCIRTCIYSS